jgi:hypothetical protein
VSVSERKGNKSAALKRRQIRAIVALNEHPTIEKAALASGIGASTIRRWMAEDAEFRDALSVAQSRLLDEVFISLTTRASSAVETLERNLSSGVHGVEVRAALGWLALLHKRNESARYQKMEREIEHLTALVEGTGGIVKIDS